MAKPKNKIVLSTLKDDSENILQRKLTDIEYQVLNKTISNTLIAHYKEELEYAIEKHIFNNSLLD